MSIQSENGLEAAYGAQACVFLDRDGTIIKEHHYLGDPERVELEIGAVSGLRALGQLGYLLVVVSNQSGIGRGLLTMEQVNIVNRRTDELLREKGVGIAAWYICPHQPREKCSCRKPEPGMIDRAREAFNIDLIRSLVIGDKKADLQLARALNLAGYLVLTGHGMDYASWARQNGFATFENLHDAAVEISAHPPFLADKESI